jgi:hypothetical protein
VPAQRTLLNAGEAAAYVLRNGFVSNQAIVDGRVSISDVSRRNRNIAVRSTIGPSYFLKQGGSAEAEATVECEAQIYKVLAGSPFRPYLTGPASYDEANKILITRLADAEDLEQHYSRRGRLSPAAARAIGRALALLHATDVGTANADVLYRPPAWALSLHHVYLHDLPEMSPGHLEVRGLVQRHAGLGDTFDGLRAEWRLDGLCHFDLKWDNILIARGRSRFPDRVRFVDWEAAGIGDRAWDVACVLASWLAFWVRSMALTGGEPASRLPQQARYPLEGMYPAIRGFWAGYAALAGPETARELLPRAVTYIAPRLAEEAVSQAQGAMSASRRARLLVQMALNIAQRQDQAVDSRPRRGAELTLRTYHREQVARAIRAVRILGPRGFSWFGVREPGPPSNALRFMSPADQADYLSSSLCWRLYEDFFAPGSARPATAVPAAPPVHGSTPFLEALSAANNGAGYRDDGWQIIDASGEEAVVTKAGLLLAVPADMIFPKPGSGESGGQIGLLRSKESLALSPGFYLAHGNQDLSFETPVLRVYWNLSPEGAIEAMSRLTVALNAGGLAFRLKAINDPAAYGRCDSVVLYLRSGDFRDASIILAQVADVLRPYAFDAVPAFAKPIARGVALAEDPGPGLSFGEHRCGLVAAGLIQAFEAGRRDLAGRLEAVECQFNSAGIGLDAPYLNPGSIDAYDFSPPATAGTVRRRTRPGQAGAERVAEEIGIELCRRAMWYEGRCTWLGPPPESERGRSLESLRFDLYAGTSGIGLFLAELAAATNNAEARRTSLGALQQALTRAREAPETSIGLYDGHTGVAVAAARAGILLDEASLVDAARSLALQQDRRRPGEDAHDDLLSGRAGAVLGFLLLSKLLDEHAFVTPALRMAEELVERSRPGPRGRSWRSRLFRDSVDQTGMSHGAAGIALGLIEASAACGDDRLRLAAEQTFDYEWSWFNVDAQNWADLRGVRGGHRGELLAYSTDWCHGAPGIALSRLAAYRAFGSERFKREAILGLDTTLRRVSNSLQAGFDAANACLCHGPLSCGDTLLVGARFLDDARYRASALDMGAVAASAWRSAGSEGRGRASPGLMTGMAGLGYFLLRASGRPMPSLLLPLAEDFVA